MADCEKCYKHHNITVLKECIFCKRQSFQEHMFCELLQSAQSGLQSIECFMYKPNLSIAGKTEDSTDIHEERTVEYKLSDKQKWLKAFAIQQLNSNPDQVFSDLNFHVCLITKNRERLFSKEKIDLSLLSDSDLFSIMAFSGDHAHLYINMSPDNSFDEIVRKVIASLEDTIRDKFPEKAKSALFEEAYFAESVG